MGKIVKRIAKGQSLAASFVSEIVPVGPFVDNIVFNIEAIGVTDNTGTFEVQHRIVQDALRFSAWGVLCLDSVPTLAGIPDVKVIYLNQAPIGELRLVFTASGSTPDGTCDIWFSGRNL